MKRIIPFILSVMCLISCEKVAKPEPFVGVLWEASYTPYDGYFRFMFLSEDDFMFSNRLGSIGAIDVFRQALPPRTGHYSYKDNLINFEEFTIMKPSSFDEKCENNTWNKSESGYKIVFHKGYWKDGVPKSKSDAIFKPLTISYTEIKMSYGEYSQKEVEKDFKYSDDNK